jgi:hypothetical protein
MIAWQHSPVPSPWWAAGGKAAEEGLLRPVNGRYESHDAPLKTIRHGHIRHNVQC